MLPNPIKGRLGHLEGRRAAFQSIFSFLFETIARKGSLIHEILSSILVPMLTGNRRPASAPKHQNPLQSENDGTIRLLFQQLRSYQSSTLPLPGLCRIESELQSYINKLKLDMENTRKIARVRFECSKKPQTTLRVSFYDSKTCHLGLIIVVPCQFLEV